MGGWNIDSAHHLLSRCLFGYTSKDITFALSYSLDNYVDNVLLASRPAPNPPAEWVSEAPSTTDQTTIVLKRRDLINWWIDLMLKRNHSLQEKMVLFWHNHFVSEMIKVGFPQRMYWQNVLFRTYAFGNFKNLTKAITIDPAMLVYLDGVLNIKQKPNENYGRELLELFTLGIGNYTEDDVKAAARSLTGWQVSELKPVFNPNRFDNTDKTFLGVTNNFTYETLIDVIFTKPQAAEHICKKLYKEFVFHVPNMNFVKKMADILVKADFEIKPLLSFLFKSDHFYDSQFRGSRIKSPVELVIGTLKSLNVKVSEYGYLADTLRQLQQNLFNPPDVRGWEGQRRWVSSATFPVRHALTNSYVTGKKLNGQNTGFQVNTLTYARSFTNAEHAVRFVNEVSSQHIRYPLSENSRKILLDSLLNGASPEEWSTYSPMADTRIANFLKVLMRLPEYQLC